MITPTKVKSQTQATSYTLSLTNGQESIPINIMDIETIGIMITSISAGTLEVYITQDHSHTIWSSIVVDIDGTNPLSTAGVLRTLFCSPYDFVKFKANGGNVDCSLTLKNE